MSVYNKEKLKIILSDSTVKWILDHSLDVNKISRTDNYNY